jgi:hypothetical protein
MAAPLSVLAPGLTLAGAPGVSDVSANTRVKTQAGAVGVIAEVVQAPGLVGAWTLGAMRLKIMGLPAINQTSVGAATTMVGIPAGPMTVALGDARVSGL